MGKSSVCSRGLVAFVLVTALLVLGPSAYAGAAQHTQAASAGNAPSAIQGGAKAKPAARAARAGLPFTGLDLTLMIGGGLILVGSGAVLGRLRARRSAA